MHRKTLYIENRSPLDFGLKAANIRIIPERILCASDDVEGNHRFRVQKKQKRNADDNE